MIKRSDILLNFRLFFNSAALLHLVFVAIMVLPIDMSKDEDPRIRIYIRVRWKLITCWCNLMLLAYFLISFYCDWEEKLGKWNGKNVSSLRLIRDNFMTSIVFPVTLSCDTIFWFLWHKDPTLIAPMAVFRYLPFWAQHSLHTLSAIKVVVDILLVPRRKPANLLPGIAIMYSFCAIYYTVTAVSHMNGEPVYSLFKFLNHFELILFAVLTAFINLFFYLLQWYIIGFVWNKTFIKNHVNTAYKQK
ncbi:androgen-dependent TFPI-regulating protein-like [Melitaea cinxia]|uniref:androgen-dependent TFPI-regulating protein-like n=1 Tax=Melitaea cinxia TaxID=113334 RepID=UPI001E270D3E|nr:androgen-dependent TFPI-regulating protein-like [Melitaea cinxia]